MLDVLGIPNEIPKGSFYDLSSDQEPAGDVDQEKNASVAASPATRTPGSTASTPDTSPLSR